MKKENLIEKLIIVILFIILGFVIIKTPATNMYKNIGELIINEVMSSNSNTIQDKYGKYTDYIELYNGYDHDIDLTGYYLSDDSNNTKKWQFPSVTIKAKNYLVIFASGKNTTVDGEVHTNFKLDTKGESVILSNSNGDVISKIYVNSSLKDTSYGFNGKEYVYYYNGTPNKENTGLTSNKPIVSYGENVDLIITEYLIHNNNQEKSIAGNYYGLIEIYNNEDFDINLEGFYLSDKTNDITKYKFPNITIKSKDYIKIYMSGLNKYDNNELHTNFKLNDETSLLILSNNYKVTLDRIKLDEKRINISSGLYNNKWFSYNKTSFEKANTSDYLKDTSFEKDIIINEVSSVGTEFIELKNITNNTINLSNYAIGDKSGYIYNFKNISIKPNDYLVIYPSNYEHVIGNKIYIKTGINNSNEIIYLYKNNTIIDTFNVGRMVNGISKGINDNGSQVYYKKVTLGYTNSNEYYNGYSEEPVFSKDGGYVEKGTQIFLSVNDNSTIYYTIDGSFPTKNSNKYNGPITINNTTVIKAISYKNNYIESEIVSRTFIVGRHHTVDYISISTNHNLLFGSGGMITNYKAALQPKISFEYYNKDGSLGVSFIGDAKLSGMDSKEQPQKSMSIYMRKEYGTQSVTYQFFENNKTTNYSSLLLRNAGEDPKRIRIMDAALTQTLKGQMDIDMQDYRPVVVYINGTYYGMYNLREKLNSDYITSKYGIAKEDFSLIKYKEVINGSIDEYNNLINYINNHNCMNQETYNYIKSQVDIQELANYWIVQSFYGNSDLGNIRYWKSKNGKWRFMLYDLDWSMWNSDRSLSYPVIETKVPAATYLYSSIQLSRCLYQNQEFKDMYLSTLAYHMKNTFTPNRMNKIVDDLAKEVEEEMPYHIEFWKNEYKSMNTMEKWHNNINNFKNMINARYNNAKGRIKSDFNLSTQEYNKYFGDL